MSDPLGDLAGRVVALGSAPVTAHPAVLDEVHRGLVAELERLAGDVAGSGRATGGPATGRR